VLKTYCICSKEKKKSPKTHRAGQTVRAGALKLCQMVGPQIVGKLSEYEADWPIGGATATKSTKLLITPRPFDLASMFLHKLKLNMLSCSNI